MPEHRLVGLATILVLGIGAQWLAWRLRLPSILLLLGCGFVAGPVTHALEPDVVFGGLLFPIVSLAVAVILFEGGLSLRLAELPHVGDVLWKLLTLGALATWVVSTLAAHWLLGMGWELSLLLGSILVVTGPTVIGPLLRHVRPSGRLASILKWEGIVIDPIGAMLAVLVFEALLAGEVRNTPAFIAGGVLRTLIYGTLVGALSGILLLFLLRRFFIPDFLQNAAVLATVAGAFALSNHFQAESGLLAVTVMGLLMANQKTISIKHIIEFKENLRVLLISALFIILAARLQWSDLQQIGPGSLVFLVVLVVVARPLCVWLSTLRSNLSWPECGFLMWMAPRGIVAAAVASIFALRLQERNYAGADLLAPVTIVVIVGTVALYGLTAAPMAGWLGVARPSPRGCLIAGAHPWAREIGKVLRQCGLPILLVDTDETNIIAAREDDLPVYHASVLSESVWEEVEVGELGRLLALTSNDEVNSLACLQFTEIFGRAEVYQLPPKVQDHAQHETVGRHHRGRLLFGSGITNSFLTGEFEDGATIQTAKLSSEFDFSAFQKQYGENAIPLLVTDDKGNARFFTTDETLRPLAGQSVIYLLRAST